MPTLRVPTVAISNDASKAEEWKGEVLRSIDGAASWSVGDFPMFVLRGHGSKYAAHARLLGTVL